MKDRETGRLCSEEPGDDGDKNNMRIVEYQEEDPAFWRWLALGCFFLVAIGLCAFLYRYHMLTEGRDAGSDK